MKNNLVRQLQCVAIDDEHWALEEVTDYVKRTPFLNLMASFSDPLRALRFLKESQVDVVFIDIRMPGLTGIDVIRSLPEQRPRVVLTTAFQDYAYEGFKLRAAGYLLKPFDFNEFSAVASRLKSELQCLEWQNRQDIDCLFLRINGELRKIVLDDVMFFEAYGDFVKIYTRKNEVALLSSTRMSKIEEKLPRQRFLRIHRSYIIAVDKIESIQRDRVVFSDRHRLAVGDTFKEEFDRFVSSRSA